MCCFDIMKRVAVVCMLPYPEGEASTVRIHSYCKALADYGCFVKIYILTPLTHNNNIETMGVYENVHFEYIFGVKWVDGISKIGKIGVYIRSLFRLRKKIVADNINCILTYHDELCFNIVMKLYANIYKIPFIIDKTEYPYHFFEKNWIQKKLAICQFSLYDGIIAISKELFDFYSMYKKNVFLLPMTVNPLIYNNLGAEDASEDYIAVVFGIHNRDNIRDSILAYIEYFKKCQPNFLMKLYLVGDFEMLIKRFPENKGLRQLINDSECRDSIKIIGHKKNKEVINILQNAKCLLSTPLRYTSGGFPTKLGEYLLSGNPVVITNAGEIAYYLENNVSAFLCEAGNIQEIANALLFVATNPNVAKEVGRQGQKVAFEKFNAAKYVPKLLGFVEQLKS